VHAAAVAALAVHLSGAGISATLPPAWDGHVSLVHGQATLEARKQELSLRLDEVGNRPGTSGFLPTTRVVLRPGDLRTPQLAIRRVAVHGRSFVVTANLPDASFLDSANAVLSEVRVSWPAGLAPAARRRLERPLTLRRLPHGARCPTSRVSRAAPGVGATLGRGPAYPVLVDVRAGANKTLWAVSPTYRGALLIRGRRLDGHGLLRFWPGRLRRMWWRGFWPEERRQWRYGPATTLVPSPGCYAFQVDGTTFSRRIVFEAR
jgi:hypothetical protein